MGSKNNQKESIIVAYEWYNPFTGHCYVDYVPHDGRDEKNGYVKSPLYKKNHLEWYERINFLQHSYIAILENMMPLSADNCKIRDFWQKRINDIENEHDKIDSNVYLMEKAEDKELNKQPEPEVLKDYLIGYVDNYNHSSTFLVRAVSLEMAVMKLKNNVEMLNEELSERGIKIKVITWNSKTIE